MPAASSTTGAESPAPKPTSPSHHADPDEVDISEHFYETKKTTRPPVSNVFPAPATEEPQLSEEQMRQLMLSLDGGAQQQGPGQQQQAAEEDPLMKMMSQIMGGAGGAGFPPGSSPFPGMMPNFPGMQQQQQQQAVPKDPYTSLWRLLHALVALGLGLYIAILHPFSGTKVQREGDALLHANEGPDEDLERRKNLFFWTFATAETLLLTTRFYLDKSSMTGPGMVATVVGFLPQPYKGYVEIILRYAKIFTTVRADMLACIFVLGVCAWWRG